MTTAKAEHGVVGVGYEGHHAEQFVDELRTAGVDVVVDVRLTPISRKPGFSKRSLAENLAAAGIDYVHLRALGNPKDNRAGFGGDDAALRAASSRYETLLDTDESIAALERVTELASTNLVAVLCFEAAERRCHRHVVLSRVEQQLIRRPSTASGSTRRAR